MLKRKPNIGYGASLFFFQKLNSLKVQADVGVLKTRVTESCGSLSCLVRN